MHFIGRWRVFPAFFFCPLSSACSFADVDTGNTLSDKDDLYTLLSHHI